MSEAGERKRGICVFCGSNLGADPAFAEGADQLGAAIAGMGARLVFGGGGRTLTADFAQANEVNDSTPVRVGGVAVGTVERLDPGPAHTTILVMRITQPGLVIQSGGRMRAFRGRAYVPQLLPPGVTPDDIR